MGPYNTASFATGFFHLHMFSRFISVSFIGISFLLWPNNIPLYAYTHFFSIHVLMDILVVSIFWLLGIMLLWTSVYIYRLSAWTCFQCSWVYIPRSGITGSDSNFTFNCSRNRQTVFQSSGTILDCHPQCMRVPSFPFPCQHARCVFSIIAPVVSVKLRLIPVFVGISLTAGDVGHLTSCFLPLCIFFGEIAVQVLSARFSPWLLCLFIIQL